MQWCHFDEQSHLHMWNNDLSDKYKRRKRQVWCWVVFAVTQALTHGERDNKYIINNQQQRGLGEQPADALVFRIPDSSNGCKLCMMDSTVLSYWPSNQSNKNKCFLQKNTTYLWTSRWISRWHWLMAKKQENHFAFVSVPYCLCWFSSFFRVSFFPPLIPSWHFRDWIKISAWLTGWLLND